MGVLIAVSCCLRLSEKPIGIITEYRSMIVARTSAKFVDLIDEDKGIAGSCRLQALHHLARHGPHIGPPMTWTLQCKYVSASNGFSSIEQQRISPRSSTRIAEASSPPKCFRARYIRLSDFQIHVLQIRVLVIGSGGLTLNLCNIAKAPDREPVVLSIEGARYGAANGGFTHTRRAHQA